jgi:hypothetical protein
VVWGRIGVVGVGGDGVAVGIASCKLQLRGEGGKTRRDVDGLIDRHCC